MSKNEVTKEGRPRRYKSDAERQKAYRARRATDKSAWARQFHHYYREIYVNRTINATVSRAESLFETNDADLISYSKKPLDRACLPDWIESLRETRRRLNRFIRFLRKL